MGNLQNSSHHIKAILMPIFNIQPKHYIFNEIETKPRDYLDETAAILTKEEANRKEKAARKMPLLKRIT
ncbi:hypothetical protein [Salinivibrio proteolyticus]|uniref:hypothetical protein n=1 Tax=Salinivibrio proteolyticus TaxID=334715 RepID=UPI000989018F|nr:hypothetical protein [Salinivibrio proteolyticus]OOF30518.1 hypothetical protein BZJ20_10295 [Salinivibrio proteolyticus]